MSRKKLITIIAVCIVVVIVAVALSLSGGGPESGPVANFTDSELEATIREALDKSSGPIYVSELARLTSLAATSGGVEDISVLEYCTNLTDLDLHDNQISDISPLVENEGLGRVRLADNPLSDDSIIIYIPQLEARGVDVDY